MDSCPMDGRIAAVETDVRRLVKVVEGNGQPGLVATVTDFIAEWRGMEKERKEQAKRSNLVWNLRIAGLMAVLALAEIAMHGCAKHISFSENPIHLNHEQAQEFSHIPPLGGNNGN